MAQPLIELGAWRREGATVGEVLEALDRLRHGERRAATRTSVVNLVAVATDEAEIERACEAVQRLAGRHPGRTITLVLDREGPARVDAQVMLQGQQEPGPAMWWEEVRLHVGGAVTDHLDSLVEPLILPDLPVALWFVGRLPEPDDAVLRAADAVLVDSRQVTDPAGFATTARLVRRVPVVDLSWLRLRPWRLLLGGAFEGEAFAPFVGGVRAGYVAGLPGPASLMAGWLRSRLELPASAFTMERSRHVSVRLRAEHAGRTAQFSVTRAPGERLVRSHAAVEGGAQRDDLLSLPDDLLPWSLNHALSRLGRDRVYEQAVAAVPGLSF